MTPKRPRKPNSHYKLGRAEIHFNGECMMIQTEYRTFSVLYLKDIRRLKNYLEKLLIWIEAKERKK